MDAEEAMASARRELAQALAVRDPEAAEAAVQALHVAVIGHLLSHRDPTAYVRACALARLVVTDLRRVQSGEGDDTEERLAALRELSR